MQFTLHRKPKDFAFLIGGELEDVHPSASVPKTLLKEAKWFKPDDGQVGAVLKASFKNYKTFSVKSRKHTKFTKDNFSFEKMVESIDGLFTANIPEFAQQVELSLPKLKLPKLKKIDG